MSWYKPESVDVTNRLTEIQKINIEHIQLLEKKWKKELETASAGNDVQIRLDLSAIPELEGMEIELVSKPSATEKYFTYKAGKLNDHGMMLSPVWLHVYVDPVYEIRIFDVVMDGEISLSEWQKK